MLNTVALYLPHYDSAGLKGVIARLTKPDAEIMPPVDIRLGEEAISLPRAANSKAIFAALESLPSYVVPRLRKSSEVRRLMKLSRLLARDEIIDEAPETATAALLAEMQAHYGRLKRTKRFRDLVEDRSKVPVRAVNFTVGTDIVTEGEAIELQVSAENLEDIFEAAGRRLGEGLHKAWWRVRVAADPAAREKAKLELIALCFLEDDVTSEVERKARKMTHDWLTSKRSNIRKLPEAATEGLR